MRTVKEFILYTRPPQAINYMAGGPFSECPNCGDVHSIRSTNERGLCEDCGVRLLREKEREELEEIWKDENNLHKCHHCDERIKNYREATYCPHCGWKLEVE